MTRGLCALFVLLLAGSAAGEVLCVRPGYDAVTLIAAGRRIADATATALRSVHVIRAERCVLPAGTRVDVVQRRHAEELATVRVAEGPAQECVGELAWDAIASCDPARAAGAVALAPSSEPDTNGLTIANTALTSPKIARWRTPDGRTFFGDKPPRGSVQVGEVEGVGTAPVGVAVTPPGIGQDSAALSGGSATGR